MDSLNYLGYVAKRVAAKITDDKSELNDLEAERKTIKLEEKKALELKAQEDAKAKEEEDKKKEEEKVAKAEAEADSEESTGTLCFGDTLRLDSHLFFLTDVFDRYYTKVNPDSKKSEKSGYIFTTLEEAKAKCQKSSSMFSSKCTGIIKHTNKYDVVQYLVYDEDPTLVTTIKPNTPAARFAVKNPEFLPIYECPVEGKTLCFDSPIQLSPTNFFAEDAFNVFVSIIYRSSTTGIGTYQFTSLDAAKEKCQIMPNCKGILAVTGNPSQGTVYMVYTGDTKLVDTVGKEGSFAKMIASTNPQFIPAFPCGSTADAEERKTFSVKRLFKRALGVTLNIVYIFCFVALGMFGASLATNLNVYRGWPYRLLYAIYGCLFFFIVIPYVLLWRWFYLKKRPRFYALIPLISSPIENGILATLLSWFTFEPDDEMAFLDGCRA